VLGLSVEIGWQTISSEHTPYRQTFASGSAFLGRRDLATVVVDNPRHCDLVLAESMKMLFMDGLVTLAHDVSKSRAPHARAAPLSRYWRASESSGNQRVFCAQGVNGEQPPKLRPGHVRHMPLYRFDATVAIQVACQTAGDKG